MSDNVQWEGEYHITYNATDSSRLAAEEIVRVLHMVEPDVPPVPVVEADHSA